MSVKAAGVAVGCVLAGMALLMQRGVAPLPSAASGTAKAMNMPMNMDMDMPLAPMSGSSPREGQPLPAFRFVDVTGREHSPESLRGSVVLLDVWASWCGPCRAEMPEFQQLQARYGAQGLRVLGVSIDITAGDAAKFARQLGVTYPIIHKPDIMDEWGLQGLPTTFIIDRAGVIRRIVIGFEYPDEFEQSIRDLL